MATYKNAILGMSNGYNANSRPQNSAIDSTIPYIREAIDALDISPSSGSLIIADFGSAHGSNSIYAMKLIIQYLKEIKNIEDEKQILVIHNDLPTNDWTSLFELVKKDNSYHGVASGRSFYEQCLPSNTLSTGFSSTSLHWLSCKPCNLSNHCISTFAQDIKESMAFKHQSKLDLATFFEHRSCELVSNGVLILNIPCVNNDNSLGFDNYVHLLYKCAQCLGLTQQELFDYTIPSYYRSFSDCVDDELFTRCSFKLIKAEFNKFDIGIFAQYQSGHLSVDQFSKIVTSIMRSWSEWPLKHALELNRQSKEEIDKILTQFWTMYEEDIREKPNDYDPCFYYTYLILKKL
ncbi:unnamed protein product [Adineta steineri]|uniref:SAM dependent carboxyl methyltransferase n=1 Tax=Adineta steineri TaxID=433720 RepID=A0A819EAY1_9BILA|nr:unnamed protein product [Adineta steineri]CAF3847682.1 unnamed protein product [Adineta steineri]